MAWSIEQELQQDPIVVTGRGAVSVCGPRWQDLVEAARLGQAGGLWVEIGNSRYPACPVQPDGKPGKRSRIDPSVQFALAAAASAAAEAGLRCGGSARGGDAGTNVEGGIPRDEAPPVDPARIGVVVGTSRGCQGQWEAAWEESRSARRMRPTLAATTTLGALSGAIAQAMGARGPGMTVSATCASGAAALITAAEYLLLGKADVMIAGGSDAVRNQVVLPGMHAAGLLGSHEDPARACRPFEAGRNGLLLGEGAAFLVLERLSHAVRRGAEPLARFTGWDLRVHEGAGKTGLSEDGGSLLQAMQAALGMSRLTPAAIGYLNAHGTGTRLNDLAEAAAIHQLFGTSGVPVSSTKPVTGHCLGATPVMEAIVALEVLRQRWLPPQAGFEGLDPLLPPLRIVSGNAVRLSAEQPNVLSNSLGFWGYHACLVFGAM